MKKMLLGITVLALVIGVMLVGTGSVFATKGDCDQTKAQDRVRDCDGTCDQLCAQEQAGESDSAGDQAGDQTRDQIRLHKCWSTEVAD